MHFFSQYRGLRRENYVLFFGRIVTNMGAMVWPMLTMILNQKLGMSAGNIAILTAVFGILMMPATLFGGKLADRLNKKNIIIVGDIVSVVCYILCGCVPLGMGTIVLMFVASLFQTIEGPAYNAIIADITSLEERDKAYSLLYWGANLGLVLSPTLSGLLFKNYLWLAFIISGVATPEPMPWITRASRMTGKVWPTIMIAEPVTARTTAAMNRDFSRKRRFRNDDSGIVAATTSRYTVVIHCTVAVFTPNSVMSSGNSTVITVSVRMPMNASEPTATMAPIRRLGMRSCEVEVM